MEVFGDAKKPTQPNSLFRSPLKKIEANGRLERLEADMAVVKKQLKTVIDMLSKSKILNEE